MRLEQTFTVKAPIEEVWAALIDVQRIAPCLPGADIAGQDEDGNYKGSFKVRLGPTTASYAGVLRMEEVDEGAHRAVMSAKGTDKRGQGGATATIVNVLTATPEGTQVDVDTDYAITGKLARFGRSGMIEDISKRLLRDFATCLESTLGADHEAAEVAAAAEAPDATTPADAAPAAGPTDPMAATAVDPSAAAAGVAAGSPPPVVGPAPPIRPAPPAHRPPVQPAKPISGFRLVLDVLLERLKKLLGRGRG